MKNTDLEILARRFRDFRKNCDGTMSVEAVLILPLLLWAYVAMFTYFDGFKARNEAEKASFTISDALTRVTEGVDENYINGMQKVYDYLNMHGDDGKMRVTEVQWVQTDADTGAGQYEVTWSYSPASALPQLTNADLPDLEDQIPNLVHGERLVIVETQSDWEPAFNVGLTKRRFDHFVPSSPRFASQVAWEGASTSLGTEVTNTDYSTDTTTTTTTTDPAETDYYRKSRDRRRRY